VIGRLFIPATLGFFDRSRAIKDLVVNNLIGPFGTVFFPALAGVNKNIQLIRKGFTRAILTLSCCIFPAFFGLSVLAENLVPFLYSDKWIPAVPYLQLLCPIALFFSLRTLHNKVYMALGRPDLLLKIQLLRIALTIISILITYRWGLSIMLLGEIFCAGFTYILTMVLTGRLIGYSFYQQFLDLIPYLIASFIMAIVIFGIEEIDIPYRFLTLILQISIGLILYFSICRITRAAGFLELQSLLSQFYTKSALIQRLSR
jgi:O-antigen/teichoic acid export membrane protein